MSKSIGELLGGRNLTGLVNTIQSGLPDFLPNGFLRTTKKVIGNKASYFKVEGNRANAQTSQYGAPSRLVPGQGGSEVGVTLAHAFEKQNHDPLLLQNLQGFNGEPAKELATEEIGRQSAEFKTRIDNARLSSVYSALANGKIWLGANGDLLYSASGAVVTVDFGVPAARQNQAGGIIGASWATAATNIITHVTALKAKQVQDGKAPLRHAFYGSNIAGYIAANDHAGALIKNTPMLATERYKMAEIPDGFAGLQWHPVYAAYGLDTSGAVQSWFGADSLVLTPEPTTDWYGFYEGSYLVPRDLGTVSTDAVAAANNVDVVYGTFGYATVSNDPVTISQFAGSTWLPILRDASAIFQLDVTP